MTSKIHLNIEEKTALAETADVERESAVHLQGCAACASDVERLKTVLDLMRRDDSFDAPPSAVAFAKNAFRAHRRFRPADSLIVRMKAVLQTHLLPSKPVFGERSANVSAVRQMLFAADEDSIDLRIRPNGERFIVSGQIIGENWEHASVNVTAENFSRSFSLDGNAEFSGVEFEPGVYEWTFARPDKEVSLQKLEIM